MHDIHSFKKLNLT